MGLGIYDVPKVGRRLRSWNFDRHLVNQRIFALAWSCFTNVHYINFINFIHTPQSMNTVAPGDIIISENN